MQAKTTDTGSSFGVRLQRLIEDRFGGHWTRLATAAGIRLSTFQRYADDSGKPGYDQIIRICEAAGVSTDWLLLGKEEAVSPGAAATLGAEPGLVYVPRLGVEASAGEGAIVSTEHVEDYRPFRLEELKRLGASPANLVVIQVRGESMAPTLQPGDDLVIDHSKGQTVVDGLWAVRVDDVLMVKRVQHLPGRKLLVTSDNPAYSPFSIDLNAGPGDFDLVGRVVWAGKRF